MFDKHPKGLIAAALANLGERFGFYPMMAILVLFLQAKFGMNGKEAGFIYSTFYFSIYILALLEVLSPIRHETTKELFSRELC